MRQVYSEQSFHNKQCNTFTDDKIHQLQSNEANHNSWKRLASSYTPISIVPRGGHINSLRENRVLHRTPYPARLQYPADKAGVPTLAPLKRMFPDMSSRVTSEAFRHAVLPMWLMKSRMASLTLLLMSKCTSSMHVMLVKLPSMLSSTSIRYSGHATEE